MKISYRYDHLSALITKILADRPKNAVDIFEDYSRKLKDERFRSKTDYLRDLYVPPFQYEEAKKFKKLYQVTRQPSLSTITGSTLKFVKFFSSFFIIRLWKLMVGTKMSMWRVRKRAMTRNKNLQIFLSCSLIWSRLTLVYRDRKSLPSIYQFGNS